MWKEHRRFALRHLKDLGFGQKSSDCVIYDEIYDLLNSIKTEMQSSDGVVDFSNKLNVPAWNVVLSFVSGKKFSHNDPKSKHLVDALYKMAKFNPILVIFPFPKFISRIILKIVGKSLAGEIAFIRTFFEVYR